MQQHSNKALLFVALGVLAAVCVTLWRMGSRTESPPAGEVSENHPAPAGSFSEQTPRGGPAGFTEDAPSLPVDREDRVALIASRQDLLRKSQIPIPVQIELHVSGNKSFSDAELSEGLTLPARASLENLEALVRHRILLFYRTRGYAEAKVLSVAAQGLDPPVAEVNIEEGKVYTLAGLQIEGMQAFPEKEIRKLYPMVGRTADLSMLKHANNRLREKYLESGFVAARIHGKDETDEPALKFEYQVRITEGPRYRVGSVSGPDHLVRMFPMQQGDVYVPRLLREFMAEANLSRDSVKVERDNVQALVDVTIQ